MSGKIFKILFQLEIIEWCNINKLIYKIEFMYQIAYNIIST